MKSHWFRPAELARKLARGEIANREVAYFMLGNMLFGTFVYYGAFTWSNAPWTILSLWECLLDVVIVVFGMIRCFDAAGGDDNPDFAAQFACLSFPISLWITVAVWPVYWLGTWLFGQGILRVAVDDFQFAKSLAYFGGGFRWLWTVAAILGSQAAFYIWMRKSLGRVQAARA